MRNIPFRLLVPSVLATIAAAQTPSPAPKAPVSETTYIKITIDPSRSPIAMDTEAGISAEIKNVSNVPVRLYENETIFMTVPEMRLYGASDHVIGGCATFPTQGNVRTGNRPARGYDLFVQPGDSYRIFWDVTRNGCTDQRFAKGRVWNDPLPWLDQKWQRITFTPGTYKVYLDAVVYPENQQPYRTATEGRDVLVSASQQMVLLGAFLGGLLAYVMKSYYGVPTQLTVQMENQSLKRIIRHSEWLVAGLFGAGMVVLASRLSDTFPVKVNANDFWGSVTLGFVFQWIGVRLLEKLPGISPATPTPGPVVAPPAPAPAPAVPAIAAAAQPQ